MTSASERVRDVLARLLASGSTIPISIGPAEGSTLRDWVERERSRSPLEVGLGYGVATLFICEALLAVGRGAAHVAIDSYQRTSLPTHGTAFGGVGLRALEDAGVRDLVEFHEEESQVVLPRFLAERRRFDFAFLDGNHRFEAVFLDLVYCGRLLEERSIVFLDDTQLPGVRRAVDFCVANLGWIVEDGGSEGELHEWLVVRTGTHDVFTRPFAEYVDF